MKTQETIYTLKVNGEISGYYKCKEFAESIAESCKEREPTWDFKVEPKEMPSKVKEFFKLITNFKKGA